MLNALTIDVEDYYQVSAFESVVRDQDWDRYESRVEANTQRLLDLLDEHRTAATFFVLGWVAERQPKLVKAIHERGHEIACHGYSHKRIYTQTPTQFHNETRRAKHLLEELTGQPVLGYRAASYSITADSLWALEILAEEGFHYDSSIYPVWHDRYGIPGHPRFAHRIDLQNRQSIAEFPLSTIRLAGSNVPVGGGGYLRLFPYALTRLAIRHLNTTEHQPAIIYLHPWEIDPHQPRINAGWLNRLRHYTNLGRMHARLQCLLRDFSFGPLCTVYADELRS